MLRKRLPRCIQLHLLGIMIGFANFVPSLKQFVGFRTPHTVQSFLIKLCFVFARPFIPCLAVFSRSASQFAFVVS